MSYQFIAHLDKKEHDHFVSMHPLGNLMQRSNWGLVKDDWDKQYVGLKKDGHLVASAQCFIRKLPLGLTMIYLARGPLLDYDDFDVVDAFFTNLKTHFKKWGNIMIKFDPLLVLKRSAFDTYQYEAVPQHPVLDILARAGALHQGFDRDLYRYGQPRYVTQLSKTVHDRDNYTRNALRNIRKGERKGVEIEAVDVRGVSRFARVIRFTEKRKNIGLRNELYFKKIMEAFGEDALLIMAYLDQKAMLTTMTAKKNELQAKIDATTEGSPRQRKLIDQFKASEREIARLMENMKRDGERVDLAGLLAIRSMGQVDLLYMGMNETYRKYYAPHKLYDYAIQCGFDHGANIIDFGGMDGHLDDGLSQFKASFNGEVVEYLGEFDLVLSPLLYQLYKVGWPLLKKIKFLIKIGENRL